MKRIVTALLTALAFSALPAHAGQWDDLRNQWSEEYRQVRDSDISALERQAGNGDVRSIYMLSILLWEKRYAQNNANQATRLQQWMCSAGHAVMIFGCGMSYQLGEGFVKDDAKSVGWIRKAAESGYGRAMWYLGLMNEVGQNGLPKDDAQAAKWYRKGAEAGEAKAMTSIGWMYANGRGVARDDAQAVAWYRKGTSAGDGRAMGNLGAMYESGLGISKDEVQAAAWYRRGAEAGDSTAMNNVGAMYRDARGGLAKDDAQALAWFRKAAEAGNTLAMANLGWMYEMGRGLVKDDVQAAAWYRKAADAGNTWAMNQIGWMYVRGQGVSKDEAQAVMFFRKGAESGSGTAMSSFGLMYRMGWGGLPKDEVKAVIWFRKGAEAGDAEAMSNLGFMYRTGRGGLPQDYAIAMSWFKKARELGELSASTNIAMMHEEGLGVGKNEVEAARNYLTVIANSDSVEYSKLMRERLESMIADGRLTDPALIRQVRALSRPAPKLDWIALPQNPDSEEITLTVRTTDVGGGVGDVKLLVDGRMVEAALSGEARGLQRRQDSGATRSFKLKLPAGAHKVEVWAYSLDNVINYTVLPATITSRYQKVRKPRLFALVLGINEYENAQLKLQYARPDAVAVAQALNAQAGTLYESVTVKLLQDKNTTRKASILAALQAWAGEGENKPEFNDVFIFYVAGHAMSYQDGGYYLLTSDVLQKSEDRVKPASISHLELRDALAAIRSGKKLALLDTCHAGKSLDAGTLLASRGMDEQDIIERMNRRSGATVLMASETSEQALEGYQGHGVFTYALLQGLQGAASNTEGFITTDLLKVWIEDQVPEITEKIFHHKQTPFASLAGQGFPVAINKKH